MTNSIVNVNVTQTSAPTPTQLQKKGALISQGATTLAQGAYQLLTSAADLAGIIKTSHANASLSWSGSVVTVTTAAPHGFTTSDVIPITIAGVTPSGYNGTFDCTITGASEFTYALVSNPGLETVPGTYALASIAEVTSMNTTFWAQGSQQPVYVLELGTGVAADGVSALAAFIAANPGTFYSYLVPRSWADESTYLTFLADFEATTSKTYFFTTMTTGNYTTFTSAMKCVVGLVQAPAAPASEFTLAAPFWVTLNYAPSSTNKVTPLAFAFLQGVTAYPQAGNGSTLAALKAAGVNYVDTGAEGGISNTILKWGTTMDVRPFNYWYSVDWVQITGSQALANAVENGSNNPINPLYYNQDGINRLQQVLASVLNSGVSFGLVLGNVAQTELDATSFVTKVDAGDFDGQTVVNAVPFIAYSAANPSHYRQGIYNGLSVEYTPARGFDSITWNVNVTDFVTT